MGAQSRTIQESTAAYEAWLAEQVPIVEADLEAKHAQMAQDPFAFFRATFYRWCERWPVVVPETIAEAPRLRAVGDLHVENFGTWRDVEGRLVWGVNDFDEVAVLPYTIDLVRTAASAILAGRTGGLAIDPEEGAQAALTGYRSALEHGGRALVLEEHDRWLRRMTTSRLRDPVGYWSKMEALAELGPLPGDLRTRLRRALPARTHGVTHRARRAGEGSLGRYRAVALGTLDGALVAREAKATARSGWYFAHPDQLPPDPPTPSLPLPGAVRDLDPTVSVKESWIIRRLSPYCSRLELTSLAKRRDEERLLRAMGWETGNVHLATSEAIGGVLSHLDRLGKRWLEKTAQAMVEDVIRDQKAWRKNPAEPTTSGSVVAG
jgi:uncharacterized protein (DUF2252 family)